MSALYALSKAVEEKRLLEHTVYEQRAELSRLRDAVAAYRDLLDGVEDLRLEIRGRPGYEPRCYDEVIPNGGELTLVLRGRSDQLERWFRIAEKKFR